MRTACFLSGVLGNETLSRKLAASADRAMGCAADKIWFTAKTYQQFPVPKPLRRISALEGELVARKAIANHQIDAMVVNGYTLAMAARKPGRIMVVATDATPKLLNTIHAPKRGIGGMAFKAFAAINHARFKRMAAHIDAWLPISERCRESLIEDYGVQESRCFVTRSPQSLIERPKSILKGPYELLFVGNDFKRKGGNLILDAFRQGMLKDCILTIVSNDPDVPSIQGINVVRGIKSPDAIHPHYRRAHLLLLPTSYDLYPNVICEGLAFGLPFIATPIAGISELIRSGAGISIPIGSNPEQLATAIGSCLSSETAYLEKSRAAISYAKRYLSVEVFDHVVRCSLKKAGIHCLT